MQIKITDNLDLLSKNLGRFQSQIPYALSVALNNTTEKARLAVRAEMPKVFDKPTPWVLNSLRVKRSTKTNLTAELAYKDRNSAESSRSMIEPHVFGGQRRYGALEARLNRIGLLPKGWNVVPGAAARLDTYGNMSRGQISQVLGVLGAYTEAGFNKANINTVKRLAKGNAKKNAYGFVYWVNPVNRGIKGSHLPPGVYQRLQPGFGSSLKPVLIFVEGAKYKKRLDFFGITQQVVDAELPAEFDKVLKVAVDTALLKQQGSLL